MWADLDCQYRLQQAGEDPDSDRKLNRAPWALLVTLALSLILGAVLCASPQARSVANRWLSEAHESMLGTWVLAVRAAREFLEAPAGIDLLNVQGAFIGVAFIGLTAVLSLRLFSQRV